MKYNALNALKYGHSVVCSVSLEHINNTEVLYFNSCLCNFFWLNIFCIHFQAEKFGDSFVLEYMLSNEVKSSITQAVSIFKTTYSLKSVVLFESPDNHKENSHYVFLIDAQITWILRNFKICKIKLASLESVK